MCSTKYFSLKYGPKRMCQWPKIYLHTHKNGLKCYKHSAYFARKNNKEKQNNSQRISKLSRQVKEMFAHTCGCPAAAEWTYKSTARKLDTHIITVCVGAIFFCFCYGQLHVAWLITLHGWVRHRHMKLPHLTEPILIPGNSI